MLVRSALLTVLLLVLAAPNAHAAIADRIMPDNEGVTLSKGTFTFGPKAAKLYRGLAGRMAHVGCGDPSIKDDWSESIEATPDSASFGRAGYRWTEQRLPARRGKVKIQVNRRSDLCFIATEERRSDDICLSLRYDDGLCVRVLVARTDKGRTGIDERARALELDVVFGAPLPDVQEAFGASSVVVLESPDASPPRGVVGVFQSPTVTAAVALLADGRRWFIRQDGDLFSTNVPALSGSRRLGSLI